MHKFKISEISQYFHCLLILSPCEMNYMSSLKILRDCKFLYIWIILSRSQI